MLSPLLLPVLQDAASESAAGGLELPWVDIVGLALTGLFVLLGVWRGLWWQVIRFLGVVAAIGVARTLTPRFAPTLKETFADFNPGLVEGILWFLLFLGGLLVASLLGMLGKKTLEAMQLGLIDRAGGAVAGALTGILLHGAFLVGMVTVTTQEWSRGTLDGSGSEKLLEVLGKNAHLIMDVQAAERLWGIQEAMDGVDMPALPAGEEGR